MVRKLKKRVGLVPNWRHCWKWATVQISAGGLLLVSALDVAQNYLNVIPPHMLKMIPHGSDMVTWIFVINLAARLIQIRPKGKPDADKK